MFKNKLENLEKGLMVISYTIFAIGLAISIVLMYILYQHTSLVTANDSINNELTGVIGDFFGGVVGTLFALVSVLLFYLAFQHQKRELSSTKEAFSQQQFETTFFNLLKNQNDIKNNILKKTDMGNPLELMKELKDKMVQGIKWIDFNIEDLKNQNIDEKEFKKRFYVESKDLINNNSLRSKIIFKRHFISYKQDLGHYFRNLYHLLLFLKENEEEEIELNPSKEIEIKSRFRKYADFIQAQLSGVELFLIFYDALFFRRFKRLVQYYKIVENLTKEQLLYPETDIKFYNEYKTSLVMNDEVIPKMLMKSNKDDLDLFSTKK